MRSLFHAAGLALLLCSVAAPRAVADDADLKITVTNGDDTQGDVRVQVRPAGQHDADAVASGGSGEDITVPPGTYDVEISINDGAANKIMWLDGFAISGHVEKTVDIGMPVAGLHIVVTNGGADVGGDGTFEVRPAGNHGGDVIASERSGGTVRVAAGTYDVDVRFNDGSANKTIWLDGLALSGKVDKTVEINTPVAALHVVVTNGGTDVGGQGGFEVRPAGHHDGDVIASERSGGTVRVAAGTYDVDVRFNDGSANKTIWLDGLALSGKVDKTVEINTPVAALHVVVTNGGTDVGGQGGFEVRPAGHHDGDVIASERSGGTVRVAAGTYDVDVRFNDGSANKTIWLDGLALSGKVDKTVEVGTPVAALRVVVTNGGTDVGSDGTFEVRPAGNHGGDVIASERSGGTVKLAAGTYDVDVRFNVGAVNKTIWLDGLALAGKVGKTVEVAASIADVTWHITNHGAEVTSDAVFQIRPDGQHGGDVIAYGNSGTDVKVPSGDYDIDVHYEKGMIHKTIWLDHQTLTGKVDRTTDLGLNVAQATVTATLNGADVGDKARIGITHVGQDDEVGDMRGGETAELEAGHYGLTATMPGAEGALRDAAVEGQAHLVVAMQALHTEELRAGGPPPKACTIEVYGVNFDFDKAVLRPESEPVLRTVLHLFTATPSFSAEVGGHTDNIGKPDYNMRLSEARSGAVKAWLVGHGVADSRVTSRGYGDTHPLVPNDTDADRFKNRRVELRRVNCQ